MGTEHKIYLMMNKPAGYVCSAVSDSHSTVYQLLPPHLQALVQDAKRGSRLHTVGRLDCETSGLLLFTTDGSFSHILTSPENKIQKTYIAKLKHPGSLDYIQKAQSGLILPADKKAPEQLAAAAKVCPFYSDEVCPSCSADIPLLTWKVTVTEGKFHEVRRIFQALGNEVVSLKRISMGTYNLPDNLMEGQYIEINPAEITV